jgi:hypothetical protein
MWLLEKYSSISFAIKTQFSSYFSPKNLINTLKTPTNQLMNPKKGPKTQNQIMFDLSSSI